MQRFEKCNTQHLNDERINFPLDVSSEEKNRILDATHELFAYYTPDLKIIWANKAAADSLNMKPSELIGKFCYELWNQSSEPCSNCPVLTAKETGKPQEIEKQTPDGRHWIIRGYPIFDDEGKLTNFVELSREITNWKKTEQALKENEQRFRIVATNTTDVIYEWDLKTNHLQWFGNPKELFDEFTPPKTMDEFKSYVHPENQERVYDKSRNGIKNHESWHGDYRFLLPDKTIKQVKGSGTAVYDTENNPIKVFGSVTNITEQKKIENALKESEERYRTLIDRMPESVLIMKDQKYWFANPSGAKLLGFDNPEDVQGISVFDTIDPDSKSVIQQRIKNAEQRKTNPPTDIKIINQTGKIIDVRTSSIPITINEEPLTLIIGQDITEEKRLEHKNHQHEKELQKLNTSLLEMLELPSVDSLYEYVGKTVAEMIENGIVIVGEINEENETILIKNISGLKHDYLLGIIKKLGADPVGKSYAFKEYLKKVYQKQEIVEFPGGLKDFSHGYYNTIVLEKLEKMIGIKKIYTIGLRRKNKLFSAVHLLIFNEESFENKDLIEAFLNQSSVALRRKILEKENMKLADIVRQSADAIIQTDTEYRLSYMNASAEELFGYTFQELKGKTPDVLNASPQPHSYQQRIYETVSQGETFFGDCLNKRKDGSLFWCQMKISPIYDENHKIQGYTSFARDITYKKNADRKIKETNEKMQKIIDSSPSGICVVNTKGIIETWSPACERIFGWSAEEVIGRFNPTVPNDKKDIYFETIKKPFTNWEKKALTKDSRFVDVSISTVPLFENDEFIGALGVMTDITEQKKIERQIRESERKYHTLFDTMAQGIVYQNKEGSIISANPAAEKILGYSLDEMKNMNSENPKWKAIHKDGSEYPGQSHPAMIAMNTGLITKDVMGVFNPKDDEYKWIMVTATPEFKDGSSNPYQTYTSFEDITELKKIQDKLAKSEQEYRTLLEEQVNGFAIFSSVFSDNGEFISYRFIDINPAYERITGVKREEVKGKDIQEIFPGTEHAWIEKYGSVAMTGEPEIFEMYHQPTNKYYYCNVYRPWKSSDRFCVIFNDVTDRKIAENKFKQTYQELHDLNRTLEEKVKQRTTEINKLLTHKDQFIHQLGHDLKNPLGPLINLLPILESSETDPKKQEMLMVINRNVGYMKNLVTKTLELARLNSPNTMFTYEEIDIANKINDIIETNKLTFEGHEIIIKNNISDDIVLSADSLRLEELFTNIINNAVKYTSKKGVITIDAVKDDKMVTISISDTGIGMTEEQIAHMFDEFYKADPSRHDFDSSGLGMSICKRIVERHGGMIWAESEGPGKGSTFYFTLPLLSKESTSKEESYV